MDRPGSDPERGEGNRERKSVQNRRMRAGTNAAAVVDEAVENSMFEAHLRDNEVGTRINLLLEVLQVLLVACGLRVLFGVPWRKRNVGRTIRVARSVKQSGWIISRQPC